MSYKGSAVVEPRQLAPSVGKKCAGIAISPVPNSANYNSATPAESIRSGSIKIAPHLPALSPAFHALHEGVNLAFGDFRLHVTREGILRLSDSPRPHATESATSAKASTTPIAATSSPLRFGSVGDTELSSLAIPCLGCDSGHPTNAEKSVDSDVDDRVNSADAKNPSTPTLMTASTLPMRKNPSIPT